MATVLLVRTGEELEFTDTTITFYIFMEPNSTIILGNNVIVQRNIWGPGNISISGNVTMNASIGVYPGDPALQNATVFTTDGPVNVPGQYSIEQVTPVRKRIRIFNIHANFNNGFTVSGRIQGGRLAEIGAAVNIPIQGGGGGAHVGGHVGPGGAWGANVGFSFNF